MEDFNSILLSLAQQPNQQEEVFYDEAEQEIDEPSYEDAPDEDYKSILSENEELKSRIQEIESNQNISDTQEEYYNYMATQDMDSPNFAMDLIMADDFFEGAKGNESSSAVWLKKKDASVNIEDMSTRLLTYLETIPSSIREKIVVTSGNDSDVHVKGSKHYSGSAIDLRYDDKLYNYIIKDPKFKNSGLNVLDPNHGTAKHLHIEEKKYGGKYKVNY